MENLLPLPRSSEEALTVVYRLKVHIQTALRLLPLLLKENKLPAIYLTSCLAGGSSE